MTEQFGWLCLCGNFHKALICSDCGCPSLRRLTIVPGTTRKNKFLSFSYYEGDFMDYLDWPHTCTIDQVYIYRDWDLPWTFSCP